MTDLTFCYLHMTIYDLQVLDTLDTAEYVSGELSDDELDIPPHMIPPNPDDSDILPSQVHPSYPYGNPTNIKHPAAKPRPPYDPTSRALFEDMGYAGGGINGTFRWRDLALERLLPVDEEREERRRAAMARKLANGASGPPHPDSAPVGQQDESFDEGDEDEEEENDENDHDEFDEDEVDEDIYYEDDEM